MKLRRITVDGFRGCPATFSLTLDGKSVCLLGENGRGKTTIVDALELWSSGDIATFHREGANLTATINLVHGGPARISCLPTIGAELSRLLPGSKAAALTLAADDVTAAPPIEPISILRHSTMAAFMGRTPGEKKRALLELLDLSPLLVFRDELKKFSKTCTTQAADAKKKQAQALRNLEKDCGGTDVMAAVAKLFQEAHIPAVPATEEAFLSLDLVTTTRRSSSVDRANLVAILRDTQLSLSSSAADAWNTLTEKARQASSAELRNLLQTGCKVLDQHWHDPQCPLCLSDVDVADLKTDLERRSAELLAADTEFKSARNAATDLIQNASNIASAIGGLLSNPGPDGWPDPEALQAKQEAFSRFAKDATQSLADLQGLPSVPMPVPQGHVDELQTAASDGDQSNPGVQLAFIQRSLAAARAAQKESHHAEALDSAVAAFLAATEAKVKTTVESELASLGTTVADYYGRLVLSPVYSNVTIEYSDVRAGGIEFTLLYDGSHKVSPPQRIVSESQLNALGLSYFLAHAKSSQSDWRTIVLDDVVNSFDSDHRKGVADLLADEFADWQVIILTHDHAFFSMNQQIFNTWLFKQIVGWSPKGGPVIDEGDPVERLEARLHAGVSAAELGTLARVALERSLAVPLEKLRLPIRFDRRGLYSASEYRDWLSRGLKERTSNVPAETVLAKIKGASYLVNLGAHDKPTSPLLHTNDLYQLVKDIKDLADSLECSTCTKKVWATQTGSRFQCGCGSLKC